MKLVDTLNIEQKQSATSQYDFSLTVASAGTGKTSTIMGRVEHLLNSGVKPEEILMISFTSKAAKEILERLEKYFDSSVVNRITAGTFHSIALHNMILANIKVKIVQKFEAISLLKTACSISGYYKSQSELIYGVETLHQHFNQFASSNKNDIEDYLISITHEDNYKFHDFDLYANIYDEFNKQKSKFKMFEFSDLLVYAKNNYLTLNMDRYKHVIVDEYQDTNPLQESLIDSICPKTLFCVGDYDQSIYGFNGSDISIISNFLKKHTNAGYFNLKRNYRSAPGILDVAEKVIKKNKRLFPKELIAEYKGITGDEKPQLVKFPNNYAQYTSVASDIQAINKQKHKNVAVLYRGNTSADGIELALKNMGIDYNKKQGSSFFDRSDVKIMISCIKISQGVFNFEDLIFAYHDLKVQHSILSEVYRVIKKMSFKYSNNIEPNLTERDKRESFYYELQNMRKKCLTDKNPSMLIKHVFDSKFFLRAIESKAYSGDSDSDDDTERLERKVAIFIDLAKNHRRIESFFKSIEIPKKNNEPTGVNLLSVHSSKGLEFDTVYLVDLVENMFPNKRLMSCGGSIEEERRLFYVAITRAKNKLWLCFPERGRKGNKNIPSIFLKEAGYRI